MRVVDVIASILKREGVEFLSCFPATPLIDAASMLGIKPVVCRQERVGVGVADGFSRVTNGKRIGVFTMQYGPGAENAFGGVATAYSDSSPVLVVPTGHPRSKPRVHPYFSSARSYSSVTKWVEEVVLANQVLDVMRRAFSLLRNGRFGPVLVEVPGDVALEEVSEEFVGGYQPVKASVAAGSPADVEEASKALLQAGKLVVLAGQGVLYAEAAGELLELAELLRAPVATTMEGKSAFPEDHQLSLGTAAYVNPAAVVRFLEEADTVFAVGCSLNRHVMSINLPPRKVIIHCTNDPRDFNRDYLADFLILGDAKLVLQQLIKAVRQRVGGERRDSRGSPASEIKRVKDEWLQAWMPKLTSGETPINPYRVVWEFIQNIEPDNAIVTHDAGSPRDQLLPFYVATVPRSYLGWGKSHALGTGLGLIMGAKLASPDKFCVNFMGDAAFGMTGLDFETAVRCRIPITTVVLNNSSMAIEKDSLRLSHPRYGTRDLGGNYAAMGEAMGGYAERIVDPSGVAASIRRAREANASGRAVLLEFITSEETTYSHKNPFR